MRITNLKPLISEEAIQTRVKEMAGEISTLYKDEPLVVVCVLKGAFMFFSDLVRHLTCKPELDFVRLASYGSAAQRSKTITFTKDVEIPLEGKHVLIVEDIVDTGHSMDSCTASFRRAAPGACGLRFWSTRTSGARCPSLLTSSGLPCLAGSSWGMVWTTLRVIGNSRRSTRLK